MCSCSKLNSLNSSGSFHSERVQKHTQHSTHTRWLRWLSSAHTPNWVITLSGISATYLTLQKKKPLCVFNFFNVCCNEAPNDQK